MSNEFDESIGLNLFLLKLCGVIPRERSSVARNILALVAFSCLSIYTISYTYEFATHGAYLSTVLESFAMILSVVGGQVRFSMLMLFRGRCQRMLNVCEVLWSALNSKEKDTVRKYVEKTRRLTCWYLSSCSFTIFFYGVAALFASSTSTGPVQSETKNLTNVSSLAVDNGRHLPYAFLVEIQETPWYEIAYAFQLLTMTHVGLTCVGADTIGPLFALIACGHFDVIKSRLEGSSIEIGTSNGRLWPSTATPTSVTEIQKPSWEQIDGLRVCLAHHRVLLEFCGEIERLTNALFLTQLIGSTYNISLVGFKLVGDDPDKYKFVTQLAIAVIQLFLCNWPADLLQSKSEAVGRSAYFSPWYRYPSWLRKPTCLVLMRAQKPARLTAGKFIVLSLETFASMISSAVSFFTLVRSMN